MTSSLRPAIESALRDARPSPPADLERGCRAGVASSAPPTSLPRRTAPAPWRTAAATAAVVAVVTLTLILPGSPLGTRSTSAAEALATGLRGLDAAEAIVVRVRVQRPDETEARLHRVVRHLRGVGTTVESCDATGTADFRRYHDARGATIALHDLTTDRLELIRIDQERSYALAAVGWADAARNVELLRARAGRDRGTVRERRLIDAGRAVRRFRGLDERGRPIEVDVDAERGLVLRTSSVVPGADGGERILVRFEYPDPASIDPVIFDPRAVAASTVVEVEGRELARRQAEVRIRSLLMMVATYAAESGGALPPTPAALAPWGERPLDWYLLVDVPGRGTRAKVRSRLEALAPARLDEIPASTVLFECPLPGGTVIGYADGYVAFVAGRSD